MTSWTPLASPHVDTPVNRKMACAFTPPLNYISAATECLRGKIQFKVLPTFKVLQYRLFNHIECNFTCIRYFRQNIIQLSLYIGWGHE